jgi:hypothetical protein
VDETACPPHEACFGRRAEGGLLSQFQLFSTPARARATETLQLERTLSGLADQAYGLTPAEIELLWKTAPPRMPIPPPFLSSGMPECSQSQVRSSGLGKAMV